MKMDNLNSIGCEFPLKNVRMKSKKGGTNCCVPQCYSKQSKNPYLSYHLFPREGERTSYFNSRGVKVSVERRKEWILRLRIGKPVSRRMSVCSKHFRKEDYMPSIPGQIREKPRLKKTALPSLHLPVPIVDKNEKCESKKKVVRKTQEKYKKIRWKVQNSGLKRNIGHDKKNGGADVLLLLSHNESMTGLSSQRSLLKKNANTNLSIPVSTENTESQPETASKTSEKTGEGSGNVISSAQQLNKEELEPERDISSHARATGTIDLNKTNNYSKRKGNILSIFSDEIDSEFSTDSEDIHISENELDDSEFSKEKYRKLSACYKKSRKKLKEYRKLCKLYVKEVMALREVINSLKQINSVADDNYFVAKS